MAEHVILVAGPMGAGKTTAISAVSDIPIVTTEARNTERDVVDKETTTVALDYGEIELAPREKLRLYGIPGQRRFAFMWKILAQRAVGLLVLVRGDAPDPLGDLDSFLTDFAEIGRRGAVVVGITRSDLASGPSLEDYRRLLAARFPELPAPVFTVDARRRSDLTTMLSVLAAGIDARALIYGKETA
ncbi:ATP/GTP-binding protein [Salinibacterium sp. ZJ70]|uniref:GTP-binding protein n=1 Tax=Salinibacterium sp. ZJ70 TaxID=2708084 RepID=UPI0014226E27|nr:ATP/GTP-binding protein [Salinibacterium sp. ZJ70]